MPTGTSREEVSCVCETLWQAVTTQGRSIILSRLGVGGPRSLASKEWSALDEKMRTKIKRVIKSSDAENYAVATEKIGQKK